MHLRYVREALVNMTSGRIRRMHSISLALKSCVDDNVARQIQFSFSNSPLNETNYFLYSEIKPPKWLLDLEPHLWRQEIKVTNTYIVERECKSDEKWDECV